MNVQEPTETQEKTEHLDSSSEENICYNELWEPQSEQCNRPERASDHDDAEDTTEFEDYIRSQNNPPGYVDLYKREYCNRYMSSLMIACDSDEDRKYVFSEYFGAKNTAFLDSKGLKVCSYNIMRSQFVEPLYKTINKSFSAKFFGEGSSEASEGTDQFQEGNSINEHKIWEMPTG